MRKGEHPGTGRDVDELQDRLTGFEDFVPVSAECNLEEYPLFGMTARKKDLEPKTYRRETDSGDGVILKREWTVIPSVEYGSLGPTDQDVFTAVLELVGRRGGMPEDGDLDFSFAEIMKILGWTKSGRSYSLIRESLERITLTGLRTRNAFYSKADESYITDTFSIWSVRFSETNGKRGRASRHTISFHKLFLNSWLAHYLKGLDTSMYWALSSPVAKRLYRLIDQKRGQERVWREEITELARQIPLSNTRYPSKIREKLGSAHRELEEKGFLERVEYEDRMVTYQVNELFARRRRIGDMSRDPRQAIALERLLAERVRGDTAQELVSSFGAEHCLKYAEALPFQNNIGNPAGWLVRAIRQSYELQEPQAPLVEPDRGSGSARQFFTQEVLVEDSVPSSDAAWQMRTSPVEADPAAQQLWDALLAEVAEATNSPSLGVWFDGCVPVSLNSKDLTLSVPNSHAAEYIESRFKPQIESALQARLGGESQLLLDISI